MKVIKNVIFSGENGCILSERINRNGCITIRKAKSDKVGEKHFFQPPMKADRLFGIPAHKNSARSQEAAYGTFESPLLFTVNYFDSE